MRLRTILSIAVIATLAFTAMAAAYAYEPPTPAGCAVLLRQAEHTSDVATEIAEAGCVETPPAHDPTAQP